MSRYIVAAIVGAALTLVAVAAGTRYVADLMPPRESAQIMPFAGSPQPVVTLQNAITETANGSAIGMAGYQMAVLHVEGVTTATLTFEGTVDNTNWIAIAALSLTDRTTRATTATADGLYLIEPAGGLSSVRARISSYTAGTITVKARGY